MTIRPSHFVTILATAWFFASGCTQTRTPIDPGRINHVVLITLADPSDAWELKGDCDRLLRPIPSVRTYACGGHFDFGRATVNSDYTVGILVSFEDPEGYRAYLKNPEHVQLVEKWKPRWSSAILYDIENAPDPQHP